jgi:hydroxypyruvate reductase
MDRRRADLLSIYRSALAAVNGRHCVSDWLRQQPDVTYRHVIAIGKAAASMTTGALEVLGKQIDSALIITRQGYCAEELQSDNRVRQVESSHPIPDQRSLAAGQILLDYIKTVGPDEPILFLISGGASALVEVLPPQMSLENLQRTNDWLLSSGLSIDTMNAVRTALSMIKGGRLTAYLGERSATVLLVSDVPDNNPAIIGSGLLCASTAEISWARLPAWLQGLLQQSTQGPWPVHGRTIIPHHIIAHAGMARRAAVQKARSLGYHVIEHERLMTGDVLDAATHLVSIMDASAGLHIWSGETTVVLPGNPGKGGRCQSLALAIALAMPPTVDDWWFLAAGTDGSDGPGQIAGALLDKNSLARIRAVGLDAPQCLSRADAGTCLQAADDLLTTGPSGTNVMDIMLGLHA